MHDTNHYGHYRGIVVDNNDPEKLGRVTLLVPQVSGNNVTDWAWSVGGHPRQGKFPYGVFSDYTTQTPAANTATVISLGQTDDNFDIYIAGGSRITFPHAGTYNIQWSGQFDNSSNSPQDVTVWNRVNGVDSPGTTGVITVPSTHGGVDGHAIGGWNSVFTVAANDYVEFWWHTTSTSVSLIAYPAGTSPAHPTAPTMSVSANLISNYVPNANDPVWVVYEGGDINFPAWMGVF